MIRHRWMIVAIACILTTGWFAEAAGPVLRLKAGQKIKYKAKQETTVETKSGGNRFGTTAAVEQIRQWSVVGVDAAGNATMELSILHLRFEQTDPNGDTVKYDSDHPEDSHPKLAEQMNRLVGPTVRRVTITPKGVVTRSENLVQAMQERVELPLYVTLPASPMTTGLKWEQNFDVDLTKVTGTEQTYPAVYRFEVDGVDGPNVKVSLKSSMNVPQQASVQDKLSLLQFLPRGTVTFDQLQGLTTAVDLLIDERVDDFAGEGSFYQFTSAYTERILTDE